jgi:hypothetical protein
LQSLPRSLAEAVAAFFPLADKLVTAHAVPVPVLAVQVAWFDGGGIAGQLG